MKRSPDPSYASPRCERVLLLLSLAIDGAATPAQQAEIDEHFPECAACQAAAAADQAVRARLQEPAAVPAGFADRIVAASRRIRLEARAQNRFLIASAAAAVLVAGFVFFASDGFGGGEAANSAETTVRARASRALVASRAMQKTATPAEER